MLFTSLIAGLAIGASASSFIERDAGSDYEYIVVGSGAGGGPVAARLAQAGHKTLLIEAGDDEGTTANYSVPAYQARSTEDPVMGWEFFVRHYANDTQQKKDFKLTYDTPDGGIYTGLDPPEGSTIKGVLYPRSAQLGGCTAHNALITIYPDESDFEYIVNITGDDSWSPANMRDYWTKIERNLYLPLGEEGHGYNGWLGVQVAPIGLALEDSQLFSMITGGADALGNGTQLLSNYLSVLVGDANADSTARDEDQALYQIPIATNDQVRNGAREFVLDIYNQTFSNGSQMYPLDLKLNTYVTKVTFDETQSPPRATGVEWLEGKYLYKAAIKNSEAAAGVPGGATASREVIVAGGTYNSPQILKLSGIGPREELESFNITVISDLPGVGTNLQDHYENVVQGTIANNFTLLDGCNFGWDGEGNVIPPEDDPCYVTWLNSNGTSGRGTYASSGFAAAMFVRTTDSPDNDYDLLSFGGPVNFRGYFPDYSYYATNEHNYFSWAILKSHPRNRAGTLTLRSADPLDVPDINFHYFDEGSPGYDDDLNQIYQAITTARNAFGDQSISVDEVLPGSDIQTQEDIYEYVRDTTWGHHCSCTCAIGADNDTYAVLDSSFRVRGVQGLRVIDASVYPKIPGTFTAASTYLVAEKGADVILSQLEA